MIQFKEFQAPRADRAGDAIIAAMRKLPIRRFAAGLALFAMLLAAAAPAISRAMLARPASATASMICTQERAPDTPHADLWECCAFCSPSAASDALPPASCEPARLDPPSGLVPLLFLHAPRPLFAWTLAQSRAPPSAS